MLKKIRVISSLFCLIIITWLFLDFTGTIHAYFGWMAKIQFLPALLSLNVGVVVGLVIVTLLLGRVYCSVICPLGVFQDVVSHMAAKRKKNHFTYFSEMVWLRYGVLVVFVVALIVGLGSIFALLEPYSAYGRIVSAFFSPFYQWVNNLLAYIAERANSYVFYSTEVWIKSISTMVVAAITLVLVTVLSWHRGRIYCNAVCPVGTLLGFMSRYSFFKPRISPDKCNGCGLCARNCKSSCINSKECKIDYSRCVTCFNCLQKCKQGAITYTRRRGKNIHFNTSPVSGTQINEARRNMLTVSALLASGAVLKAQEKKMDGGLAFIEDKKIPQRGTPIVPPGAQSIRHFTRLCTGCQLCVSVCPNQVLRPSDSLESFMQPEVSYERGYCRPECTKCAEVCPARAIHRITAAEKSSIQIGHAVWIENNCVVLRDGVDCGNCARHCPTGAILMVETDKDMSDSPKIPVVDTERCIGCGACENLCPARPFSAIYIEGHRMHRTI